MFSCILLPIFTIEVCFYLYALLELHTIIISNHSFIIPRNLNENLTEDSVVPLYYSQIDINEINPYFYFESYQLYLKTWIP
jgi:hypothetical protein